MNKKIIFCIAVIAVVMMAIVCLHTQDKIKNSKDKEINNSINESITQETDEKENDKTIDKVLYKNTDEIIGNLIIDKISLNAPIKDGSTNEILSNYIGHIEDTAIYNGNIGLAAHNRGNEKAYFSRLNELENGDKIIYSTNYGDKQYEVVDKKEILETDYFILNNTKENELTLITCIKNRPNQRLCVQAKEIESN